MNTGASAQTSLSLVTTLNTDDFFDVNADITSSALPTGAATSALQSTGNNTLKDLEAALGAKNNASATTDTGTFSLISLTKRGLEHQTEIIDNQTNGTQQVNIVDPLETGNQIMYVSNEKLDMILIELQEINRTLKKIYQ